MAMPLFEDDADEGLMGEINMTPLIDVMLVLLIVFMIAIPAIEHAIKLDLPHVGSQAQDVKPAHIEVGLRADGTLVWDGANVDDAGLRAALKQAAQTKPQPQLRLRADRKVPYERVADVMSAAQESGLTQIGFVTEPRAH
ncbi:biopolymer transporter ExbD [Trinickia dabaoshanensis]|uniref:Biopolymer transporter ExbD n=1 Tax=Trinickia dabaoshanensis TaxID=564714 RepID=A0A2N7VLV7_9BURK|nr:biopolymer transporter ExbD [Trinickia dabaoshanensis]PMS18139.1 biopolymer transporter ExbD [Trinickia dabaoshanensis]